LPLLFAVIERSPARRQAGLFVAFCTWRSGSLCQRANPPLAGQRERGHYGERQKKVVIARSPSAMLRIIPP